MKDRSSFIARVTGLLVANTLVQNLTEFEAVQLHPRAVNVKMSKLSTPKVYNHTFAEAYKANAGVHFKFQNVYFQQAMEIYEEEEFLRHQVLQGLSTFALKKDGNFSCDRLVMFVLDRLLRQVKSNNNVADCCRTFGEILNKSSENMELTEGSSQALRIFMTVWIQNQDPQVQQSCQHIIRIYINRCLTSRDYGFIYAVIFYIYDSNEFQPELMAGIEAKIIEIVNQDELKHQFMKGLFKYLLTYLSVTNNTDIMSSRWELGVYEVHYETLKSRYPKILKKTNKINGFSTLHRWISNNYLSFNELIQFSRNSLAGCFIFNIFSYCLTDKAMADIAAQNFLQVCTKCDSTCICLLFEIIIDEVFKVNKKTVEPGSILINLASQCLRNFRLMQVISPEEAPSIIKPIDVSLPHRTRLQILFLYSVVLEGCTTPVTNQLLQAFCRIINSIFDNLAVLNESLIQKYLMVTSTFTLMKKFYDLGELEMVLALRKKLEMRQNNQGITYGQRYFQKYLMYSLMQLVEKTYSLPNQMREINRLIMIQEEKKASSDIYMYMHGEGSTSSSSMITENPQRTLVSQKRLEYLERQLQRFSDQQIIDQPNEMTIVIHDRNKNSIVSETVKGDESLQQIFGLIRDGGKSVSEREQNPIVQRSRAR